MNSDLWLIYFLLKKKWLWLVGIILVLYFVILPYQQNILIAYQDIEYAKNLFCETNYLYHGILSIVLVFQAAVQLMSVEILEVTKKNLKIIKAMLGVLFVYEILAFPIYIWYISIYSEEIRLLVRLIILQFLGFALFFIISIITKRPLIGFLVLFLTYMILYRLNFNDFIYFVFAI